jgi:hypothetical protein
MLTEDRARHRETVGSMFKWFIGALVATNGGALVSLLNLEASKPGIISQSGYPFALGLILALLSGFVWAVATAGYARDIANELWSGVVLEEQTLDDFRKRSKSGNTAGGLSMLLLLAAAGALIIGIYNFSHELSALPSTSQEKLK